MKDVFRVSFLFDFYGPLLTEKQQDLIKQYFLEDLSLAEIAEGAGVSRQAVHDLIKRAESALEEYERKLGLVATHLAVKDALKLTVSEIDSLAGGDGPESSAGGDGPEAYTFKIRRVSDRLKAILARYF